jgi:iron complex outermembrane recepter protein
MNYPSNTPLGTGSIAVWIGACLTSAPLWAQQLSISGTVSDPNKAVVSGTSVALQEQAGATRETKTDIGGSYSFNGLPAGTYTLSFSRPGFETASRTVSLTSEAQTVDITLALSSVATTVEVRGTATDAIQLEAPAAGGTRLDLPVSQLPASLSIIPQQMMEEQGAQTGNEAVQLAVGMVAGTSVGSIPTFETRGFNGNNITLMRDGIRQDTVSQSSAPLDTFILDSIEILKGPASVLYSEGAVGAAINLVSKQPLPQFQVTSLLSYGSWGTYRTGVGVTGPLGKKAMARFDLSRRRTDGYVRNSAQLIDSAAASIKWNPLENLTLSVYGTYTMDFDNNYYGTPLINGQSDPATTDINYNMANNLARAHNRWLQFNQDLRLSDTWRIHNQAFAATQHLDWRNFESYTYNPSTDLIAVSSMNNIYRNDFLGGDRVDFRGKVRFLGRPVSLDIGAELQNNNLHRDGSSPSYTFYENPLNPAPFYDPGTPYAPERNVVIGTYAVFAEAVVDITSRVKLVAGFRPEELHLDYIAFPSGVDSRSTYRPITYRGGLLYDLGKNTTLYASYSKAVQPVTQFVSDSAADQSFSLTPATQWEIGAKATAINGRITGTLALFDLVQRDILTTNIVNGQTVSQEIGKQMGRGIELSVAARVNRRLTIMGDFAPTDARYEDYIAVVSGSIVSYTGHIPTNTPRLVENLRAQQRIGRFTLYGTVHHVGRAYSDTANTVRMWAYTTLDAAISYPLPKGQSVALRGRNLTNELYADQGSAAFWHLGPPRSVEVDYTFRLE